MKPRFATAAERVAFIRASHSLPDADIGFAEMGDRARQAMLERIARG